MHHFHGVSRPNKCVTEPRGRTACLQSVHTREDSSMPNTRAEVTPSSLLVGVEWTQTEDGESLAAPVVILGTLLKKSWLLPWEAWNMLSPRSDTLHGLSIFKNT